MDGNELWQEGNELSVEGSKYIKMIMKYKWMVMMYAWKVLKSLKIVIIIKFCKGGNVNIANYCLKLLKLLHMNNYQ